MKNNPMKECCSKCEGWQGCTKGWCDCHQSLATEKSHREKLVDSMMNDIIEHTKRTNNPPMFQYPDWLTKKLEEFREKFVDHLDSDTPVVQVSAGDIESWLSSQFLAIDAAARKEEREKLEQKHGRN